uniref:Uncharacterized protein n=1 Tax=Arundo donax TaxID=35708 RepID=A0A0A9GE88_ARUDO
MAPHQFSMIILEAICHKTHLLNPCQLISVSKTVEMIKYWSMNGNMYKEYLSRKSQRDMVQECWIAAKRRNIPGKNKLEGPWRLFTRATGAIT